MLQILLLMCIATVMSSVVGQRDSMSPDSYFVDQSHELFEDRDRSSARSLQKHEFVAWVEKHMFEVEVGNITNIYETFFLREGTKAAAPSKAKGTPGYLEVKRLALSELYDSGI